MLYDAPLLLSGLVLCCFIWRSATLWIERVSNRHVPSFLNWFAGMYLMLGYFLYSSLKSLHELLSGVTWSDPMLVREVAKQRELQLISKREWGAMNMTQWDECCNLVGFEPLIFFSMSASFWGMGAIAMCIYLTFMHWLRATNNACTSSDRFMKYNTDRDQAMAVCILPAFYSVMALKGLVHVWSAIVNDVNGLEWMDTILHRAEFRFEMLESCFLVGDVYEGYALLLFANLTMNVIQQQGMHRLEAAQTALRNSVIDQELLQPIDEAQSQQERIINSLHGVTILGVIYFAFSLFAKAAYSLIVIGFKSVHNPLDWSESSDNYVNAVLHGAGLVTSMAAIQNLIIIERVHGHTLLQYFRPISKFWSAKVLVSLSFMQKVVLMFPPFSHWSSAMQHLLYTSVICFECFWISFMQVSAWAPTEEWYESMKEARKKSERWRHAGASETNTCRLSHVCRQCFTRRATGQHSDEVGAEGLGGPPPQTSQLAAISVPLPVS